MDRLKNKYTFGENFADFSFMLHYMQHKHAPEAEKLAKLTGVYTMLSPLCPNPNKFKPVKNLDIARISPHVSLEEYMRTRPDDGLHWNSKRLVTGNYCYSLYPTLEMVQNASYVIKIPRIYVRFVSRRIQQKYLVEELFDWKNQ